MITPVARQAAAVLAPAGYDPTDKEYDAAARLDASRLLVGACTCEGDPNPRCPQHGHTYDQWVSQADRLRADLVAAQGNPNAQALQDRDARIAELTEAVTKVNTRIYHCRILHQPVGRVGSSRCALDDQPWPCETIRIISGEKDPLL